MIVINIHLDGHLGDMVYTINILHHISMHNDIVFDMYGNYDPQLVELVVGCDKLNLLSDPYIGDDPIYSTWCGNYNFPLHNYLTSLGFEATVLNYFKYLFSNIICLDIIFDMELFEVTLPSVNDLRKLSHIAGNVDYLIINSDGCSGQIDNNRKDMVLTQKINDLAINGYNVWCTKKVSNLHHTVNVTTDYGYTLRDISEISIYSDNIIAVSTSPIVCCLNKHNSNKSIMIYNNSTKHVWNGNAITSCI